MNTSKIPNFDRAEKFGNASVMAGPIVLRCTSKYRLPERARMAHHPVSKAKDGL